MENELLLESIKEKIIQQKCLTGIKNISLTRTTKFAYDNPAKKNGDGNVVSRTLRSNFPLLLGGLALYLTIEGQYTHNYLQMFCVLPVLILVIVYIFFFPGPNIVIINDKGITIRNKEFLWENYIGAYYFVVPGGRSGPEWTLVLIRPDGSYVYMNFGTMENIKKVSTAIRDFQPTHYI